MDEVFSEVGYGEETEDDPEAIEIIKTTIEEIVANLGLSPRNKYLLSKVLFENLSAFGCEVSKVQMSRLSPMKVQLIEPHPQLLAQGRTLGQEQTIFLREKLEKLEEMGIMKSLKILRMMLLHLWFLRKGQRNGEW